MIIIDIEKINSVIEDNKKLLKIGAVGFTIKELEQIYKELFGGKLRGRTKKEKYNCIVSTISHINYFKSIERAYKKRGK